MNEAEHLVETRRWLRYAHEDLEGAETLLAQSVRSPFVMGIRPRCICGGRGDQWLPRGDDLGPDECTPRARHAPPLLP
jgi:hypothetical protein